MKVKEAVREIMAEKGIGTNLLARMINKIPQTVSDRLNPDKGTNLSIDKLDELLGPLGYKIVLMPAEEEERDGWYRVEDSRSGSDAPGKTPD